MFDFIMIIVRVLKLFYNLYLVINIFFRKIIIYMIINNSNCLDLKMCGYFEILKICIKC